jgi:DNA-binding PadR family transcriptional regulator
VPLHHAVLALLREGPSHGYDLKDEFEALVGPRFGGLNIGHLYQLLERLARDGLAETHREPQEARPDRLVYTLTDKGRGELRSWLDDPGRPATGYRDDFFLKVAAARRAGDAALLQRVVDQRRDVLLAELRDLAALRADATASTFDGLLVSAAELQTRGHLQLLDQIEDAVPRLLAEGAPSRAGEPAASPERAAG